MCYRAERRNSIENIYRKLSTEAEDQRWEEKRRGSSRAVSRYHTRNAAIRFSAFARQQRTSAPCYKKLSSKQFPSLTLLHAIYARPTDRHPRDLNWIAGVWRAGERELISRLISENTLKRPRSVRENVGRRMRRSVAQSRIIRFICLAHASQNEAKCTRENARVSSVPNFLTIYKCFSEDGVILS